MLFENLQHADPIIVVDEPEEAAPQVQVRGIYAPKPRPVRAAVIRAREWEHEEHDIEAIDDLEEDPLDMVDLSDEDRENRFWALIGKFNWRNASDQRMNQIAAERIFNAMSIPDQNIFKGIYKSKYDDMWRVMHPMIADRGADALLIIGHFIAMGKDTYRTVMEAPILGEFFIDSKECQMFPVPRNLRE